MRTIYRLDGKMINVDAWHSPPLIINGIGYPILRPFMQELGIVEAQVDDFPDLALFDCAEDEAGNLTITPKSAEFLAARKLEEQQRLYQVCLESRKAAYLLESDPLMYDYLQDKIEKQVWLDKITEIKARFPKPETPVEESEVGSP